MSERCLLRYRAEIPVNNEYVTGLLAARLITTLHIPRTGWKKVDKAFIESFTKFVSYRRHVLAQDVLDLYHQWKQEVEKQKYGPQHNQTRPLSMSAVDFGINPPDFEELYLQKLTLE